MIDQPTQDKISATIEAGLNVAAALRDASHRSPIATKEEIYALAARITVCNRKENHWAIEDAWNERDGECFTAVGQFWRCGSKLCSGCIREHSRRSRVKLRAAIAAQPKERGDRWFFTTITIPKPGLSLTATRDIVNNAWSMFRKRKFVCDLIKGGAKSEEFTLNETGYHYHLHLLTRSTFFRYETFRRNWSECVDAAFEKAGLRYSEFTTTGYSRIDFRPVKNFDRIPLEICKYITKSDSWRKMPASDLISVALIRRWPRMFELFGTFKPSSQRSDNVHTSNLSDGEATESHEYWRTLVDRIGTKAYVDILQKEFEDTIAIRRTQIAFRWPGTSITTAAEFTAA